MKSRSIVFRTSLVVPAAVVTFALAAALPATAGEEPPPPAPQVLLDGCAGLTAPATPAEMKFPSVPVDAVLVSVTKNADGSVVYIHRGATPKASQSLEDLGLLGPVGGMIPTVICDPPPPSCETCVYDPHYRTVCSGCGSCHFTSCGTGQACKTTRQQCWICNPNSWSWCNPEELLGWDCLDLYCC